MSEPDESRRQALAEFLKQQRAGLDPGEFGLLHTGQRRTPGLRREEVAMLAGVSTSWYTWLEQGREVTPSIQVIDSLARFFKLTPVERQYLLELAHPEIVADLPLEQPDRALRRMINLIPAPGAIMDRWWFYLAWNPASVAVFGTLYEELPPDRRNMLWLLFQVTEIPDLLDDWETVAREAVGQFRAAYAEVKDSRVANELVDDLQQLSPEFASMWAAHEVAWRGRDIRRVFHPEGDLTFTVVALRVHDERFPRTVVWVPENDETQALMDKLMHQLPSLEKGFPADDL